MDQDNQNGVAVSSWNSGDIEPPPPKKARMCNNIVEVLPANDDIPKISKGCTFVDYWKKKADEANDYDKPNCKTYFISFDDISFVEPLSPKTPETENKRETIFFIFPDGSRIYRPDLSPCDAFFQIFVNILEERDVERLNYYEFVVNPDDFGDTLSNCLIVSNLKLTEVEENVVKEMGENVNQIQTNQNITTLTYSKFQGLIIELDLKKNLISYDYLYTKEEYEEWKKEYNKAQIEDNDVEENVKDDEDDLI